IGAVRQFYLLLLGRVKDQLRDLTFCRQRLRHLQETLEAGPEAEDEEVPLVGAEATMVHSPLPSAESFWESVRQSASAHVVVPEGEQDLERAASRFLSRLTSEQWTNLDQVLQDGVLGQLGGLHAACMRTGDLLRNFAGPLLDQAVNSLGEYLPTTDVAQ